jgi:cold-shock-like DNA binding protein
MLPSPGRAGAAGLVVSRQTRSIRGQAPIAGGGYRSLQEGQKVEFDITQGQKGPRRKTSNSSADPPARARAVSQDLSRAGWQAPQRPGRPCWCWHRPASWLAPADLAGQLGATPHVPWCGLVTPRGELLAVSAVVALDSVRGPGCHMHDVMRAPAGRRDHHGCSLQRDAGVLAVHRAAVNQPTAIRLALGDRYAQPTGPRCAVRRRPSPDGLIMTPA